MIDASSAALPARTVAFSAVREQVYMIFPNDLNSNETVFGGLIMAHMDRYAAVVADRHAAGVCVTASVDAVHFMAPARKGDVLVFAVSVNRAWNTSMEVGVRVEAEQIGIEQALQVRRCDFRRPAGDRNAGIGDDCVNRPEGGFGSIEGGNGRRLAGHVHVHRQGIVAAQFCGQSRHALGPPRAEDDARALAHRHAGEVCAETRGGAGNQANAVGQSLHVSFLWPLA